MKRRQTRKDIILFKIEPNQHTIYDKSMKKITLHKEELVSEMDTSDIGVIKSVDAGPIPQKVDKFENKYTSWINGKLIVRNDPMDEVVKCLGR